LKNAHPRSWKKCKWEKERKKNYEKVLGAFSRQKGKENMTETSVAHKMERTQIGRILCSQWRWQELKGTQQASRHSSTTLGQKNFIKPTTVLEKFCGSKKRDSMERILSKEISFEIFVENKTWGGT